MSLYRASPADGVAWITGGSSGIGMELAFELSRRGYKVAISARGYDVYDGLAEGRAEAANIHKFPCDVTDPQQTLEVIARITETLGPICLAVLNAGTYIPMRADKAEMEIFRKTYEVNYFGVLNGLLPMIKQMGERGRGQIAITASVTAYNGLPMAGPYGSTKAALNSLAQSLKFDLDRMNIRLQIINPGFVESELTKKNDFFMPGIIHPYTAALRICAGLERGGFEIRFPKRVALPLKFMRLLPYPVYFWLMAKITGSDKPLA
ncbi:MAG: SDR family NAD(P)-dependent oxidoreductase [Novosphingobium sp.]|nr:SDR family NAD(P)-dependent oxidoreductase [Novosphingobium sp.]